MIIEISPGLAASLRDPEDFRRFHVELDLDRTALPELRARLGGLADWVDAEAAWIAVDAMRQLPGVTADPAWENGLATMIEKARPHGWIREQPVPAIRAHLVWRKE